MPEHYSHCPVCGKHRSHRLHSDRCAKTLQRNGFAVAREDKKGPKWNEIPYAIIFDKRGRRLK